MKLYYKYIVIGIVGVLVGYGLSSLSQPSELTIEEIIDRDRLFCKSSQLFTNDGDVNYMIFDFYKQGYLDKYHIDDKTHKF